MSERYKEKLSHGWRCAVLLSAGLSCSAPPHVASPAPPADPTPVASPAPEVLQTLSDLEVRVGGRLGVHVIDTGDGSQWGRRSDERFALCSTFKWVLAADVLSRVDRGEISLTTSVAYTDKDLLEYAPVTRSSVEQGALSIEQLTEAAVTVSDNTAANLLLPFVGGPAGLTEFMRKAGDEVTRLDRPEPELNSNESGDLRDTTTPRAMAALMNKLLVGDGLTKASRARLLGWMRASPTGKNRLRAGFPRQWTVADKTGSCGHGAVNDVAVVEPPGRAPLIVAVYLSEGRAELPELEAAHAEVARIVAQQMAAECADLCQWTGGADGERYGKRWETRCTCSGTALAG